ncbi:MAG: M23 family metallopeptidase [Deltaproteobacteria bacterium]|nr:M23 family metallopeptidase [Deltaproteobacteria bacterium]
MTINPADTAAKNPKKRFFRPALLATLIIIAFALSFVFFISPNAFSEKFSGNADSLRSTNAQERIAVDTVEAAPKTSRYDFKLDRNQTFYSVMSMLNVPGVEIQKITQKAMPIYDLKKLQKDAVLRVHTIGDQWDAVEYRFSDIEALHVKKDASSSDGLSVLKRELSSETRIERVSGIIESSLFEAGVKSGADPHAVMTLSDIFAWDVDFASDIRKGDTFAMLYELLYVEGKPIRAGRIIGAEMVNDGQRHVAVYFEDSAGKGGYYDDMGRGLARSLLKSPLRYRRISSYFTKKRFHPILKKFRPHHGIDYSAPTGTPVEAAGGGKVVYSGWKSGYGNYVEIKHNNGYVTAYGHFSKIKQGVRSGAKVDQGDIIGYVGSTGISTGPHLHYEIRVNGRLVNPLGIKSLPDKSVAKADMQRFASVKERMFASLTNMGQAVAYNVGAGN